MEPLPGTELPSIEVSGEVILQYGMVDATALVHGEKVIYDPQSHNKPLRFLEKGSSAHTLAVVLNRQEAARLSDKNEIRESAMSIRESEKAEVVVVKDGPRGALVVHGNGEEYIPIFDVKENYLIGSGDVFSAIFALEWGVKGMAPVAAAKAASLSTALWCATQNFPLPIDPHEVDAVERWLDPKAPPPVIYLAAPFFSVAQLWLVNDVRNILLEMGVRVFSPYHDVGLARNPTHNVAEQDLRGLQSCDSVLALLDGDDPGTVFETGYARRLGLPVVGFRSAPAPESSDTMLWGTGSLVTHDLGTAVYKAIWAAAIKMP